MTAFSSGGDGGDLVEMDAASLFTQLVYYLYQLKIKISSESKKTWKVMVSGCCINPLIEEFSF